MKKFLTRFSCLLVVLSAFLVVGCEKEEITENANALAQEQEITQDVGERIINAYINDNLDKLDAQVAKKGSKEYLDFLLGVDFGNYPDLTNNESTYISSEEEFEALFHFIFKEREHLYPFPPDGDLGSKEIHQKDDKDDNGEIVIKSSFNYNRWDAKEYALDHVFIYNPIYPDFNTSSNPLADGGGDCTNFVSQAVYAGGVPMQGSGDGCKHENTYQEWYMEDGGGAGCWGSLSDWEWSLPWSVTYPFRYYHNNVGNATALGWTRSPSTADYFLQMGDVVQLQRKVSGGWQTYHTMIVTLDLFKDLEISQHSINDIKKLSEIPMPSTKRFQLIQF